MTGTPLGELIYIAVKPIFKIYLIIGVGFYLARKNILTVDTSKNISTIAIQVLIPCLTFQKIVTNINNTLIHEIATIVVIGYFMMFSQAVVVFAVGVAVGCPRNWWGGLILCGLLPNISDLPIAYLQTMETADIFPDVDLGVSFVMIYMGLQLLLQFTLGSYKLIEHDFQVDLRMEQEREKHGGDLEQGSSGSDNRSSSEEVAESDKSREATAASSAAATAAHDSSSASVARYRPPVEDASGDEDHEDLGESIASDETTDRFAVPLESSPHAPAKPARTHELSKLSSRVSLPGNILQNSHAGQAPEGIQDIIRVYSKYDQLVEEQSLERQEEGIEGDADEDDPAKTGNALQRMAHSVRSVEWKKFCFSMLAVWKDSLRQPASVTLVISVAVSMIPWVQALFVESKQTTLPAAPDKQPPLSFIMDFASYIGAAQVPFGLLLLGGTIGRLRINDFPKRLWRIPIAVTFLRLFIFPIIGCAFNSKIYADGLFYNNDILYFLSNIDFCLPPATSLLYITAFYTPSDGKNHIQMDILALIYIFHYTFLVICLPFTATYTMKVALHY
ncbi:hypothetical protein PICMEDRAFT_16247 [Pichia membranifaciens NRRL Y-2026]|uniref:Auxin efflux carrier n=1 Tax=Pichia membranifaciens NRRL Y-2026 TaxID=763406 RepID=A0A1E3NJP3_9ASCO|nr:hypothetical protein PICMEDRAFT_16247 [Pichia membranifaciens NRRL Y-2026]ODQ46349.1 hypothetical protein PICMEDRAFT_16247 [Pichia membranifaciens NRRL Y-2026]